MAPKKNLFHLWLGLPPQLTNPNRFQLLGIDPRAKDEALIRQKATKTAKDLLQKLKQVPVRSDAEKTVKQKLQAKIVLAQKTMISPTNRKEYLATLLQAKAKSKKQRVPNKPSPANPTPLSDQITKLPEAGSGPSSPPTEVPSAIPSAIPMALPVSATPPQIQVSTNTETTDGAPNFSFDAAPQKNSEPSFDGLESAPTVRVYAKKRKTSKSWIVPLVVLVLLVGGVGALLSMLSRYSNVLELIPDLKKQNENVVAKDSPAPSPTPSPDSAQTQTPKLNIPSRLKIDPSNAIAASPSTPLAVDSKEAIKGGVDSRKMKTKSPDAAKSAGSQMKTEEGKASDQMSNPFDIVDENSAVKMKSTTNAKGGAITISDEDLTAIRLALLRSRDALFTQSTDLAARFAVDAQKIAKRLGVTNPEAVISEQRSLIEALKQNKQMAGWLDDFWGQVKSASIEKAGSQELTIGDKTMAMVEGREEDLILRIAGRNELIEYRDMTPMMAIKIGEMGSKKSVPRWNLAKAAFIGVMAEQHSDLLNMQSMLLTQAEAAGFDIESEVIRRYTNPKWLKLGLPKQKLKPLTQQQFNKSIVKFRKDLGYDDPSKVPVNLTGEYIDKLTLTPKKKLQNRVACLWEAVTLIENGSLMFDLGYVNRELVGCLTEVDFDRSFADPIMHIAQKKKGPKDQDTIARQIINFVNQYDGNPNLQPQTRMKLLKLVLKISEELDNRQLKAMGGQLMDVAQQLLKEK